MIKIFLGICFFVAFTTVSFAQKNNGEYGYYIAINNVNTKNDIKNLNALVKTKQEVLFFTSYKVPLSFCILKTKTPITKAVFAQWIQALHVNITEFKVTDVTGNFKQKNKFAGTNKF